MANTTGTATVWNTPSYLGVLYKIGANQTPFLNMLGGLNGTNARYVGDFQFSLAVPWALNSAAQPAITETTSLTAPTAVTYVRAQDVNTVQIFQTKVSVSYSRLAVTGQVVGDATTKLVDITDQKPVPNEKDFQIMAHMEQIAFDAEYTFLNGAYQQATAANVAAKCRGIVTACSTNAVNAASATLSKDLINNLLRTMAGNGARFKQPIIFCNGFQRQKITDIYGYQPQSFDVGGVSVQRLVTDFCEAGVIFAPNVPTNTLLLADMAFCRPVYLSVPGKGVLFYEPLQKAGASEDGMIFGLLGLDYGPEEYHGKITSLATS